MTREEAKKIALKQVEDDIVKHGEDAIYMMSPKIGKDYWTYKEAKESILKDECLEDTTINLIDSILKYEEYAKEHNLKSQIV